MGEQLIGFVKVAECGPMIVVASVESGRRLGHVLNNYKFTGGLVAYLYLPELMDAVQLPGIWGMRDDAVSAIYEWFATHMPSRFEVLPPDCQIEG